MKFTLTHEDITKLAKTSVTLIGVYEKGELTPSAEKLDQLTKGFIKKLLKEDDTHSQKTHTSFIYSVPHVDLKPILIVGLGERKNFSEKDYRRIIFDSIKGIPQKSITKINNFLTEIEVEKKDITWKIKHAVEASSSAIYQFDEFKSEKKPLTEIKEIAFAYPSKDKKLCENALKQGISFAESVIFTKNLANLPSNICTPTYLAQEAKKLASKQVRVNILDRKDMEKLGMGALLAVAKGSNEPPKLIALEYRGANAKEAPVAFVGKGITFDTGGISIKPSDGMVGMKYDMCGAATVLGVIKGVAALKLPINVVGIIAASENMPSGTACKPEDIVTSMSGQTIEIMNTDAEGRLVLSDALTYCERYQPDAVIDIATLTGAVVIALGYHASAVLSNHEPLAQAILSAGLESQDRAWQLPLWDEYQDQLKSPFADMSNVGGRSAGVITAACFLSKFAKKFKWAHLDVAGTAAMMGGAERMATGRPVPLLLQYLINRCDQK